MIPAEETYEWQIDEAIVRAEEAGFEIIRSDETTLLIDIDDTESKRHFDRTVRLLHIHFGLEVLQRYRSKSGEGWHVVCRCKPCDFTMRVALQACLGSDRKREALALMMAADGQDNPSVLFKPKQEIK